MRGGSLEDPDPLDRRPITRLLGSVYRRVCKHASVTSSVRGSGRESRGGMKSDTRVQRACTNVRVQCWALVDRTCAQAG